MFFLLVLLNLTIFKDEIEPVMEIQNEGKLLIAFIFALPLFAHFHIACHALLSIFSYFLLFMFTSMLKSYRKTFPHKF